MKILFVVPYVPNLVRVRPYNLIRHLVRQGHEITVATLYSNAQDLQDLEHLKHEVSQVVAYSLPVWRSLLNSVAAIPSHTPLQAVYCWQPELSQNISRLLADNEQHFDIVHVEHLRGARYGLQINQTQSGVRVPVVWDSVDNITHLFKQSSVQSKRWINRWITRFELARTAQYESWLVDQFQRVLVTSPNDRQAFIDLRPGQAGHEKIQVLPNGVDLEYFTPAPQIEREPATLVVSGKMSYHANITMALVLAHEIMPRIWQHLPEVRLLVVGKDPPPQIQSLAGDPRIEVTGTVPDIRPYLHKATLAVAPVQYGAGIQNKVLEAMACATPVISSSQAVSALTAQPGFEIEVADQPQEFADKAVQMVKDPSRRERIGKAGLQYVQRCHDWQNIVMQLEEIYRSALVDVNN